jgi:hypothetical protein
LKGERERGMWEGEIGNEERERKRDSGISRSIRGGRRKRE